MANASTFASAWDGIRHGSSRMAGEPQADGREAAGEPSSLGARVRDWASKLGDWVDALLPEPEPAPILVPVPVRGRRRRARRQ
jgi:hypothetical protein